MKKYWLVLYPDTFLWVKNCSGLIFNSKDYRSFTFVATDEIKELCNALNDLENLYSVEISESLLCIEIVNKWIDNILNIGAGSLAEQTSQNKKLVSFYPIHRIHNDITSIIRMNKLNMGGEIIENLYEIIFHINGSLHGSKQNYLQTNYPVDSNLSLDFDQIKTFVNQCNNRMLQQITFIGDIFRYKQFKQLQEWILNHDYSVEFVLLVEDIETEITELNCFNSEKINFTIIVSDFTKFSFKLNSYQKFPDKITLKFPVTSIREMNIVSTNVEGLNFNNYNIIPVYNGSNSKFFEDYVYMKADELNDIELSKREVFVNMTMNAYFFGKLIVMPDGKVYSNSNDAPLGNVNDPIYDMLYKEMTDRKAWFRIRDMKPCCDCVYQWLCPSPGNYESVIDKPNLCHINP